MSRARWAKEWFTKLSRVHDCVGESRNEDARIRIAILDSGVDKMHDEMARNLTRPESCTIDERSLIPGMTARPIKDWRGFPKSLDPLQDRVGHGTHCASVVLRTAPYADIYIARIFDDHMEMSEYDDVVKVTPSLISLYYRHSSGLSRNK